jgi:hypothetical protein
MRNSLLESLVVGCGIALGTLVIGALTHGAPVATQLLALLAAGLVLFCMQLALTLHRARRAGQPPEQSAGPAPRRLLLRRSQRNPFFRELTDDWTGLDDHLSERGTADPYASDELDGEIWGDLPETRPRKGVTQPEDKHRPMNDR